MNGLHPSAQGYRHDASQHAAKLSNMRNRPSQNDCRTRPDGLTVKIGHKCLGEVFSRAGAGRRQRK